MAMSFGSERYAYLTTEEEHEEIEWTEATHVHNSSHDESSVSFSSLFRRSRPSKQPKQSLIMEKFERLQARDDDGETCVVDLLDTAGQEEYSSVRDQYVREGQCFLIVFDITRKPTLEEAVQIFHWIKVVKHDSDFTALLCGNKIDLVKERQVKKVEGETEALKLGIGYMECSAKSGENVEEVFSTLIRSTPRIGTHYKSAIVGSGAVGKTAITIRFCNDTFLDMYDPTIEDSYTKVMQLKGLQQAGPKNIKKSSSLRPLSKKPARPKSTPGHSKQLKSKRTSWSKMKGWLTFWKHNDPGALAEEDETTQQEQLGVADDDDDEEEEDTLEDYRVDVTQSVASNKSSVPKIKVRVKAPTCNVVAVSLGSLEDDLTIVTGDAVFCSKCGAVMTHYMAGIESGKLVEYEGQEYQWKCHFCDSNNIFKGCAEELNEVLTSSAATQFILSPPNEQLASEMAQGLVVYCIDVSGSMNQRVKLPESQAEWRKAKKGGGDSSPTAFNRLQCIKQAILRQLERLQIEDQSKRVVIVSFESAVRVYHKLEPQKLEVRNEPFDALMQTGEEVAPLLQPLKDSYTQLVQTVESLAPMGSTGLGPALTVCCGLAKKFPYSEVVLCTDGEPNTGIGSLSYGSHQDTAFYTQIGEYACGQNTKISIIALEGQEVTMNCISQAATLSGGSVTILNPAELARQVRLISQKPVIATKTEVELFTHPCIRFADATDLKKMNYLKAKIGNVTAATDLTYFYELNHRYKGSIPQHVPFQIQIRYTKLDGSMHLRVLAEQKEATKNRKDMEETCNIAVVAMASNKQAARQAQKGFITEAHQALYAASNLIDRCATTAEKKEEQTYAYQNMKEMDAQLTAARNAKSDYQSDRMTTAYCNATASSLVGYENIGRRCQKVMKAHSKTSHLLNDQYYSQADSDSL